MVTVSRVSSVLTSSAVIGASRLVAGSTATGDDANIRVPLEIETTGRLAVS